MRAKAPSVDEKTLAEIWNIHFANSFLPPGSCGSYSRRVVFAAVAAAVYLFQDPCDRRRTEYGDVECALERFK